jgi:hypothetical protein
VSGSFYPLSPLSGATARALLPLDAAGARPGAETSASTAGTPQAARAAQAARQFQALFLMEMLKPMTEGLGQGLFGQDDGAGSASGGEGGGESGLSMSSGSDTYSWFWNEALSRHLSQSWPLPQIPGTGATAAAPRAGSPSIALPRGSSLPPVGATAATTAADAGGSPADGPAASSVELARFGSTPTATPSTPGPVETLLQRVSRLFKLPANLVKAVVMVESGGQPDAVSPKGAVGLMQVMPDTAREMGIRDPSDPWENLYAGVKYLSRQMARFDSLEKALAAYNAGPSSVEHHGGVPPYPETRAYVNRVLQAKTRLDQTHPEGA